MLNKPQPPYLGAAYYPEVFGEKLYEQDIKMMHECGINCVRIAEFAWSNMEPSEGCFDFEWLHKIVDRLYDNGIAVILCTPSATPPQWLTDKYPDTLQVLENGERNAHGARCHVCKTSEIMREKNRIITEKMCREFAFHRGIVAWQIDNEIYPYQGGCFCEKCKTGFHAFLKKKYKNIENLNKKWMNNRWSLNYISFDKINPPRSDRWNHPSLQVEWSRFQSEQITSYVYEQADIIHKYFNVPVGTDMMPMLGTDYYQLYKKLDIVMFNHYDSESNFHVPSFWYDFLRPIKDEPFLVTETQVGWSGAMKLFNGYRHFGNCYVNTWQPILKGAQGNMYWHFREHNCGHEIHHGALLTSHGRPNYAVEEIKKASDDIEKCSGILFKTKVKSEIALMLSTSSWRNLEYAPEMENFSYIDTIRDKYHKYLRKYNVDVIDAVHCLDGYNILISPFMNESSGYDFKGRVLKWVNNGGKWIVGPMSDVFTDYCCKFCDKPHSFLEDVAGIYEKYIVPQEADDIKIRWEDGKDAEGSIIFTGYELKGAKALACYENTWLKDLAAVTEVKYGNGSIIVVGTVLSGDGLLKLINLPPISECSDNIELTERYGENLHLLCVSEIENKNGYISLDGRYEDLISGKVYCGRTEVKPFTVMILKEITK